MIKEPFRFKVFMKQHFALAIFVLIFIFVFVMQMLIVSDFNSYLPDVVVFKYRTTTNISPIALEAVENTSAITSRQGTLTSFVNNTPVQMLLTNTDYADISGMTFTDGAYFKLTDEPLTNRFVVIGEELSLLLFKSDKAVGQRVIINDIPFTVCGVYKQDKNVFKRMAYGTDYPIYIPIISDFGSEVEQVLTLSDAEIIASAVSVIGMQMKTPFYYDYAISISSVKRIALQTIPLTLFICGLILSLWLVIRGASELKSGSYKNKKALLITLGMFLLAIIIFLLVSFKLYIPFSWFPEDNIFDFEAYFAQLISIFQNRNTYNHSLDIFWNYAFTMLPLCFMLGIASIVAFIPVFSKAVPLLNKAIDKLKGI